MAVTLHVCVTCKAGQIVAEGEPCAGQKLHGALTNEAAPPGVDIVPVECLSACTRGATIALSSPGRWSYVYGGLKEADAQQILSGAAKYAATADGIVPWRERPEIFRKQSVARIPPWRDAAP
jgi:predicted metal-binding protein